MPERAGERGAAGEAQGILLAFDFGARRIGVASGNRLTRTATPVATLRVGTDLPWHALDRIVAEWRPALLVVGLPPGEGARAIAARVARFVAALERRYSLTVATVDETLTSHAVLAAQRDARRSGYLRRKSGRHALDSHAACLIAEQWMSEQPLHDQ